MRVRHPAFVLLNPSASGGRAEVWWEQVIHQLDPAIVPVRIHTLGPPPGEAAESRALDQAVRDAFRRGRRLFLAAGGDGTVGLLADTLMRVLDDTERRTVRLGAVGLGSSNDFHRPTQPGQKVGDYLARLDHKRHRPRDLGMLEWRADGTGDNQRRRCFVVSASIGIVTLGNQIFNQAPGLIGWWKRHWTNGAIVLATLEACRRYQPFRVGLVSADGEQPGGERIDLTHLGVMKSPYLAGGLRYDLEVPDNDGLLTVAMAYRMGRLRAFRTLLTLVVGGFAASSRTGHFQTSRLVLECPEPLTVELDGEVITGRDLVFHVLPGAINVCGPGLPDV